MRYDIAILLVVTFLMTGCRTVPAPDPSKVYVYTNGQGQTAVFDTDLLILRTAFNKRKLATCAPEEPTLRCFEGPGIKLLMPVMCDRNSNATKGIRGKGISWLSLDGLSDAEYFYETERGRFGYSYSPTRGLIRLVLIADDGQAIRPSGDLSASGDAVPLESIYTVTDGNGPFACSTTVVSRHN